MITWRRKTNTAQNAHQVSSDACFWLIVPYGFCVLLLHFMFVFASFLNLLSLLFCCCCCCCCCFPCTILEYGFYLFHLLRAFHLSICHSLFDEVLLTVAVRPETERESSLVMPFLVFLIKTFEFHSILFILCVSSCSSSFLTSAFCFSPRLYYL